MDLATFNSRLSTLSTRASGTLRATAECLVQPQANILRQREQLAVAIKLNGFACAVKDRVAVVALPEVNFDRQLQFLVQLTIKIIRKFVDRVPTFH